MRPEEGTVSYSPASARCAAAQPNRLIATSADVGWTSLLVDLMEGRGRAELFETRPTPDVTLVVALAGSHAIEVWRAGRWHGALYQAGAAGLTPPTETVRMRWRCEADEHSFQTAHLYLPATTLAATADEYRRAGQACDDAPCSELVFADAAVAQVLAELVRAMHAGAPDLYAAQAGLWLAAHLLFRHARRIDLEDDRSPGLISDRRLARTIEFMSANLAAPLTLAQLAREAGISLHHFGKVFKQQTGTTPAAMLTSMRMAAARRLVRTTNLPIAEIGRRCGYTRASAFSAAFSRHHGAAPATARRGGGRLTAAAS